MMENNVLDSFFSHMEKNAGVVDRAVSLMISHPKELLGGLAAIGGAAYLGPKLYYILAEEKKKKQMRINNELLAQLLAGQSNMISKQPGSGEPPRNTYDPIIY